MKSMAQGSFSRQIDNFAFIFYPKAWTMPNMSIRHAHGGIDKNTYALDENLRCTHVQRRAAMMEDGRIIRHQEDRRCRAFCTETMIQNALRECLYHGSGSTPYPSNWFFETVTFKSKALRQLSTEWYTRSYKNKYTKEDTRWVFYHDCLGKANENTFYKGMFDHLLPNLVKPWACQVCGTEIPKSLRMAVKLQKADITL